MGAHEITPHEAVDVHVNYTVYENFLRHLPDAWLAFTEEQLASKNVTIGTTVCVREVDHHYVAREGCDGLGFVTVHTGRIVSFVVTAIVVDSEQTEINARADKACELGSHIYFKVAGTIVGPRPYVIRNTEPKNKKTKRAASSISQKEEPEQAESSASAADAGWAEVEPKKARARRPEKVLDVPGSDPAWGLTMALLGEDGEDVNQKLLRMGRLCQWYISVQEGPCTVTLLSVFPEERVAQFLSVSQQLGYIKAHGKNLWGKGLDIAKIIHVIRSVIIMLCLTEEEKADLSKVLAASADASVFMQAFYNKYGGPEKALEMLLARAIAKENAKEKVANNPNEKEVKP